VSKFHSSKEQQGLLASNQRQERKINPPFLLLHFFASILESLSFTESFLFNTQATSALCVKCSQKQLKLNSRADENR